MRAPNQPGLSTVDCTGIILGNDDLIGAGTWTGTPEPVPAPLPGHEHDTVFEPIETGRSSARHDCGPHGHLTRREICAVAGINESSVHARLQRGITGVALCAPAAGGGARSPWRTQNACQTRRGMESAAALRRSTGIAS